MIPNNWRGEFMHNLSPDMTEIGQLVLIIHRGNEGWEDSSRLALVSFRHEIELTSIPGESRTRVVGIGRIMSWGGRGYATVSWRPFANFADEFPADKAHLHL